MTSLSFLYTGTLLRHLHDSARVAVLANCQSALFAAGEGELESVTGTMEIAGFTFPVENDAARLMMAAFYRQLRDGSNTGDAISVARNANLSDHKKTAKYFIDALSSLQVRGATSMENTEANLCELHERSIPSGSAG